MANIDNSLNYLGNQNKKMTVSSVASNEADTVGQDKGFLRGNKKKKKDDMKDLSSGLKGAQMLIKTLFPSDEPIPRR